ncbi:MAG: hypothetical protein ACKOEM_04625 [Planctomycetia bacterium]
MCERPNGNNWHYGPSTGCSADSRYAIYDNDLNGLYVLHRPDVPLRPQLKARIIRQTPLVDSPYKGVTEAELLYNVDPPREWVYRGDLDPPCWDVLFPPAGDLYCVDYRCGQRNPWYSSSGFGFCVRGKCTTTNQGVTKPHLYYYSNNLSNQTADLYLKLIPKDYETDIHGRFPTWWQVGGVEVRDGGVGYSEGDFLFVYFDERRPWLGGEIMTAFPRTAPDCLLPTNISWIDKYGYGGTLEEQQDGSFVWVLYQRLRVTSVDENGAITAVEVVPIYRHDEYVDAPICLTPKSPENRRKHYVGYGRVLCHPRSVQLPGIGYTVGDSIEFYCDDPPCDVVEDATATVTDVDEEGGILDWEIKGTDAWRYNSMNFCVSPFTVVDGVCTTSCIKEGEPDERGRYKWEAKSLCSLTWQGVGNPVRVEVNAAPGAGCRQALTTLSLTINRVACETSIEAVVGQWPFGSMIENSSDLGATRMLYLFPPYPACHGGGAVVRPVFGSWGANESDFGSSLAGTVVEAGGAAYCYRDKRHVEPTLPHDVPTLGSGTGARIASFQFAAKHSFPNPAAPYGDTPVESDRFSYFPVTGAAVDLDQRGSGYTVGQEFDVRPEGGLEVSDMWKASGADTPEQCPYGAWYGGERALLNDAGYRSLLYDVVTGQWGEAVHQEPSVCRLRVAAVNEAGGIEELEVVHGGMMFKAEYTDGKKNPLVSVVINSTLGYGAYIESLFDTTWSEEDGTFGELVSVSVVPPPPGTLDPKHPFRAAQEHPATEWRPAVPISQEFPAQPMPTGGRDYADQSAGYFWMLQNVNVGNGASHTPGNTWSLLAYLPWHCDPWVINPLHPEVSTHTIIEGTSPQFVPKSSLCAFGDCYHDLLSRTYPLVRVWGGSCSYYGWADNAIFEGNAPMTNYGEGRPSTGYLMAVRKGKFVGWEEAFEASSGDLIAEGHDYTIIEHGPTITIGYTPSSPCPDHSDGATTNGAAT